MSGEGRSQTADYPCPECGFDGPHTTCEVAQDGVTYECGACYVEFFAPTDDASDQTPGDPS